jgi:hypothetical protein
MSQQQQQRSPFDFFGSLFGQPQYQQQIQPNPYSRRVQPGMTYPDEETMRAPRRIDPDYFFGRRQY